MDYGHNNHFYTLLSVVLISSRWMNCKSIPLYILLRHFAGSPSRNYGGPLTLLSEPLLQEISPPLHLSFILQGWPILTWTMRSVHPGNPTTSATGSEWDAFCQLNNKTKGVHWQSITVSGRMSRPKLWWDRTWESFRLMSNTCHCKLVYKHRRIKNWHYGANRPKGI